MNIQVTANPITEKHPTALVYTLTVTNDKGESVDVAISPEQASKLKTIGFEPAKKNEG